MNKIYIVHSNSDTTKYLQQISENYLFEVRIFNPLKSSTYMNYIFDHQPYAVLIESSFTRERNNIITSKINALSSSTKVMFICNEEETEYATKEFIAIKISTEGNAEIHPELALLFKRKVEEEISKYDQLTETEKQIFILLIKGLSPRKISFVMHKNYHTIRKHLQNIYQKTGKHAYKSFRFT